MKLIATILSLLSFALANPLEATRAVSSYQATEKHIAKSDISTAAADTVWELFQFTGLECTGTIEAEFTGTDASVCINFVGVVGAQSFVFFGEPLFLELFLEQGCLVPLEEFEDIDGICLSLNPGAAAAFSFATLV